MYLINKTMEDVAIGFSDGRIVATSEEIMLEYQILNNRNNLYKNYRKEKPPLQRGGFIIKEVNYTIKCNRLRK